MEKILFPVKIMNITQGMNGGHSHKGTKAIDCGWVNEENKKLYAPFTGKIAQIKTDSNAVWFQSKEKVLFADGSIDYATVRTVHDNDVSDLYVGKEIKQGEYYYKMGDKGNTTGVHVHIEISKGHVKGYAPQNKYGNWEMPNTINVYDGFCLTSETVVQDGNGYNWKYEKEVEEMEFKQGDYVYALEDIKLYTTIEYKENKYTIKKGDKAYIRTTKGNNIALADPNTKGYFPSAWTNQFDKLTKNEPQTNYKELYEKQLLITKDLEAQVSKLQEKINKAIQDLS